MIEYCFGIYYYVDKETGNIVYIGKDSHIDKNKRCKDHLNPSRYYAAAAGVQDWNNHQIARRAGWSFGEDNEKQDQRRHTVYMD